MAYLSSICYLLGWQLLLLSLGSSVDARSLGLRNSLGKNVAKLSSNSNFDYVIVGGGTAGLTVASRLSEESSVRVAVVEAGDFYEIMNGNQSQIPANDALYNGKDPADTGSEDWDFTTTPQTVSLKVAS